MRKILLYSMNIFITATVLLVTAGFNVFVHECNISQKSFSSILVDPTDYLHENNILCAVEHHHQAEHKTSCSSCNTNHDHHESCCDTETHFVKLDLPTLIVDNNVLEEFNIDVLTSENSIFELQETEINDPETGMIEYDRPPPPSGIKLLISLNQLKTAIIS